MNLMLIGEVVGEVITAAYMPTGSSLILNDSSLHPGWRLNVLVAIRCPAKS